MESNSENEDDVNELLGLTLPPPKISMNTNCNYTFCDAAKEKWSCNQCGVTFYKLPILWDHQRGCLVDADGGWSTGLSHIHPKLPPIPTYITNDGNGNGNGNGNGSRYNAFGALTSARSGRNEAALMLENYDSARQRYEVSEYVPGDGMMSEEVQLRMAIEASLQNCVYEEEWAIQASRSMFGEKIDGYVRLLELGKEIDEMQIAMTKSLQETPLEDYGGGIKAWKRSLADIGIHQYGTLIVEKQVLDTLWMNYYFHDMCSMCRSKRHELLQRKVPRSEWNLGLCTHFGPGTIKIFMVMRHVCKEWMLNIDMWLKRRKISKFAVHCDVCSTTARLHAQNGVKLPYVYTAKWRGAQFKLSNDYVLPTATHKCFHPNR